MITARFLLLSGSPTFSPSQEETLSWILHFEGPILALLQWRSWQSQGDMPTWISCLLSRHLSMRPWNSLPRWFLVHFQGLYRLLFRDYPQAFTGPSVCLPFSQTLTKGDCLLSMWKELSHVAIVSMCLRGSQLSISKTRQTWWEVKRYKGQAEDRLLLGFQGIPELKCYWAFQILMKVYLLRY